MVKQLMRERLKVNRDFDWLGETRPLVNKRKQQESQIAEREKQRADRATRTYRGARVSERRTVSEPRIQPVRQLEERAYQERHKDIRKRLGVTGIIMMLFRRALLLLVPLGLLLYYILT